MIDRVPQCNDGVVYDFLARRTGPVTKTAVTQKRNERLGWVQRLRSKCQERATNSKHPFDKNWDPIALNRFLGLKDA